MSTALVIFNGIRFPYYLVHHAVDWAEKNKGSLHVLFVHSDKEPPEGYVFPSDIDPAEDIFNKKDAETVNERVIDSQIKLISDMAREKNIPATTNELINPSLDEILEITESANILFIDAGYDKAYLLHSTGFNLKSIIKESKCPVELVYDNE